MYKYNLSKTFSAASINPAPTVSSSIPRRDGVIINTASAASQSIPPCGGAAGRWAVGAVSQSIPPCGGAVSQSIPPCGASVGAVSSSIPPCGASVGAGFIPARNHGGIIHYYMLTSKVRPVCHVRSTLRPMDSAGVRRSGMTL